MKNFLPLLLSSLLVPVALAGPSGDASNSVVDLADREIVRRQNDIELAQRLIEEGRRAASLNDIETAYVRFLDAVELLPSGEATRAQRESAVREFSTVAIRYAEWLIGRGRFAEAEQVAKTVLLPQFNPTYRPAVQLLANLEQPDYYNKTVTPQFAAQKDQVIKLLQEADNFQQTGRFDLATRRFEQVLSIDPYNNAARQGMEALNKDRSMYYGSARNETRSRMLWEVTKAWERPVPKAEARDAGLAGFDSTPSRGIERIQSQLNRIIIPRVEMNDWTVRRAITFLQQQSERLDTVSDDGRKGVNIILNLGTSGAPPIVGETPVAEGEEAAPVAPVASADTPINLSLSNVPLAVALKYVADLAGLRVKVEPFAVSLVPLSEPVDALVSSTFRVPPDFIQAVQTEDDSGFGGPLRGEVTTTGPALANRMNAQKYLESQGIPFPTGSSAQYISAGSRLAVVNTPENIELIRTIVEAAGEEAPRQVEIETKFLEVSQNNLSELGFDWLLGPVRIPGTGAFVSGGDQQLGAGQWPFGTTGQSEITRGLRSGSGILPDSAVTVNSIDALLIGAAGANLIGPAPGIFGISGIFTNPQFQVLIRALSQKKGIDLLSAPKVTAKSGQEALIRIVRRFLYPTVFDPPTIPGTTSTPDGGGIIFFDPRNQPPPTVTPAFPSEFVERDIGVTLRVTPNIGGDSYEILMELQPEVVEFDGFVNYGSPITTVGWRTGIDPVLLIPADIPESIVLTENRIPQPIFQTRRVTTNVRIWDGQTIGLGGLIREDVQKVADKVPILGDIPLAGRLFRSNVDQKIKRNLIIFVTAQIIDPEGRPIRRDEEMEEIVDPLGLPERIPAPVFPAFKGSGK